MSRDDESIGTGIIGSTPSRSAQAAATIASRVVTYALGFAGSIVVSRTLGPSGRGAYYVPITLAATAVALGHLSLEQAHVFMWTKVKEKAGLFANAVVFSTLIGVPLALLTWGAVAVLGPKAIPIADPALLVLALLAVPVSLLTLYLNGLLILDGRISLVNRARVAAAVVQIFGLIGLAIGGRLGVREVVAAWTISATTNLVVVLSALRVKRSDVSISLAAETLRRGCRYHPGMVAVFLLFRVDVFLLNARVSAAEVGLYSLAVTLAELTYLMTDSVAQVTLHSQTVSSLSDSGHLTAKIARTNVALALGFVATLGISGPFLIPLAFGRDFLGSLPAFLSLIPGVTALAMIRPVGTFLIRLDRPWVISAASYVALAVNVLLNLTLIPIVGIVGAGLSSSVAYILLGMFYMTWFLRASGLRFFDLIPRPSDLRGPINSLRSLIWKKS